jgi:peptidoglycan/LPS O-acetylase OafA/YrhL
MQYEVGMRVTGDESVARINILRGLAIIGVVAVHTSAHFPQVAGPSPVVDFNIVVDVFAHFAVPLFVLLSGLTLSRRYGPAARAVSPRAFYARRLTKIVPPYIVFSLLYLLLFTVEYQAPALLWVVFALLTGSAYYHLWFVALLVQLYLLFPLFRDLLAGATARRTGEVLLVVLLLQLGWNLGAPVFASQLPSRPLVQTLLSNRIFLSHIFYFVLGMAAGLNLPVFDRRMRWLPMAPILVAVVVLVALTSGEWIAAVRRYGSFDAAPASAFIPGVTAEPLLFVGTIVLLWQITARLQQASARVNNALVRLGILSLPIYLVHVFFQWLLVRAMAPLGLTPATWGFYPVMFIATLLLSYLAARILMRVPFGPYIAGVPATESSAREVI